MSTALISKEILLEERRVLWEVCKNTKTKDILGYRRGKTHVAVAKENKREEARQGQRQWKQK